MNDTKPIPEVWDHIPDELKALRQWVCYRLEKRSGNFTKIPYRTDKVGRGNAKTNDPSTWHTYEDVVDSYVKEKNRFDGIGFILAEFDPYVFIDLDHVVHDGILEPWAQELIDRVDSYTEYSQSGSGIHIIAKAKKPGLRCRTQKKPQFEIYETVRLMVFTGNVLSESKAQINDAQDAVNQIYYEVFGDNPKNLPKKETKKNTKPVGMSDPVLIEKAMSASNKDKFSRLWNGNIGEYNGDASAADMALCCMLAYWTDKDPLRIDRLFRESGLMRDKWDEYRGNQTYGQLTIGAAIEMTNETYADHVGKKKRKKSSGSTADSNSMSSKPKPRPDSSLPVIHADCNELMLVTDQSWKAIALANNPAKYFLHSGMPSRLEMDETGVLVPKELTVDRMRYLLARAAYWVDGRDEEPAKPPVDVVKDVLATPNPPLPVLTRITDVPVFAPDGSLSMAEGYNPAGQTYRMPRKELVIPDVPENPSQEDIDAARNLILTMISEFCFVDDADRAHAVSLLLLPFVRDLIDGPTPNHLLEAPSPGSGKGLLAKVLLIPSCGQHTSSISEAKDDDEWRKRLTAQFKSGRPVIWLDNITRTINSGSLASALTATIWEDRILGKSENNYFPVRCAWVTTANNPSMTTEIARRCVRVRLDPKIDRPWQREGFKVPELEKWASSHRGELIAAALTLGQAWIAAGRPQAKIKPLGSYESWTVVIGGILAHAGIPGFLSNLMEFYEQADVEGSMWRQFIEIWWEQHGDTKVGVSELFTLAYEQETFDLGKGSERSQKTVFGRRLGNQRDRVIGNYRITYAGKYQGAKQWMLMLVDSPSPQNDPVINESNCPLKNMITNKCAEFLEI
ncbi:MAG: phage NrS-1 polymerase family protein [Armatimonadota bacterium]